MNVKQTIGAAGLLLLAAFNVQARVSYQEALDAFKLASPSAAFFDRSYAYAVFPTVATGALVIGAAYGRGRVYVHQTYVGDTTMGQVRFGFQPDGPGYSQILFFEDKHALDAFQSGHFELASDARVTVITLPTIPATAATPQHDASARGFDQGVAVFILARGGDTHTASVGGQRFSYQPRRPS